VLVAAALALVLLAGCTGRPRTPTGFGEATEKNFRQGCTQSIKDEGIDAPADYCTCVYEAIVDSIPFDEFKEINSKLSENPQQLPDRLLKIRDGCADAG
jgi:hypothetical protein